MPEQAPEPGFGQRLLEALGQTVGGLQFNLGPDTRFGEAAPAIGGTMLLNALLAPTMKGRQGREDLNAEMRKRAAERNAEILWRQRKRFETGETIREKRATREPKTEQEPKPEMVIGPDGNPVFVRPSEAYGRRPYIKPEKPDTEKEPKRVSLSPIEEQRVTAAERRVKALKEAYANQDPKVTEAQVERAENGLKAVWMSVLENAIRRAETIEDVDQLFNLANEHGVSNTRIATAVGIQRGKLARRTPAR